MLELQFRETVRCWKTGPKESPCSLPMRSSKFCFQTGTTQYSCELTRWPGGGVYHTPSWIWGSGVLLSYPRQTAYWDNLGEFSLIDKGTYYSLLLCEATPELLYPAFGPLIQGWCGEAGEDLAEGNQDDQQPTPYSLWEEAKAPGLDDRQQLQASAWEVQAGHCEYLFQHWNAGKW